MDKEEFNKYIEECYKMRTDKLLNTFRRFCEMIGEANALAQYREELREKANILQNEIERRLSDDLISL